MKNKAKIYILIIIPLLYLPVLAVGGTMYVIDPLQIYHKSWFSDEPWFWWEQRYQNAGKIRTFLAQDGYDSIILGSSVADCFLPKEVEKQMGWQKTMKLTMNGGEASEHRYTLEHALNTGAVKYVMWNIRPYAYAAQDTVRWHNRQVMPKYLYTWNIFDDEPYLLSTYMLNYALQSLEGKPHGRWMKDLNLLNYWLKKKQMRSFLDAIQPDRVAVMQEMLAEGRIKNKAFLEDGSREEHFRSVDYFLLDLAKKHPEVKFLFVMAPERFPSRACRPEEYLETYFAGIKYLVNQAEKLPNVEVYGFEDVPTLCANAGNFRDFLHYHSGVALYMTRAAAEGRHRLTAANYNAYEKRVVKLLKEYELVADPNTIVPFAREWENKFYHDLLNGGYLRGYRPKQRR